MIIELYRKTLNEKYNGDKNAMIRDGFYSEWTDTRIRSAFNDGKGTEEHFKKYMENNKHYCVFMDI